MNIRILPLSQMVPLSSAWMNEHKAIFLSIEAIAGVWPLIKKVHEEALQVRAATRKGATLARMQQELFFIDLRHDRAIHVIFYGIEAEIAWCYVETEPDLERAERLASLRQAILPDGIAWTQSSYLEESGNAERVISQLDDSARALLATVPIGRGTLLDVVNRWGTLAARLGDLQRRRSLVADAVEAAPNDYATRMNWIRVVNSILSLLELSTAPADAIKTIRQPLIDAVAAEQRREATRQRLSQDVAMEDETDAPGENDSTIDDQLVTSVEGSETPAAESPEDV